MEAVARAWNLKKLADGIGAAPAIAGAMSATSTAQDNSLTKNFIVTPPLSRAGSRPAVAASVQSRVLGHGGRLDGGPEAAQAIEVISARVGIDAGHRVVRMVDRAPAAEVGPSAATARTAGAGGGGADVQLHRRGRRSGAAEPEGEEYGERRDREELAYGLHVSSSSSLESAGRLQDGLEVAARVTGTLLLRCFSGTTPGHFPSLRPDFEQEVCYDPPEIPEDPALKRLLAALVILLAVSLSARAEEALGYYRFPAIHGDTVVFGAEGDLWRVGRQGGVATRLTTHPGDEIHPAISPDGKTVAFSASYEGPTEVYAMPVDGGVPRRLTFEGGFAKVTGWTPGGEILYATAAYSGLPAAQLVRLDPATGGKSLLPLAQASEGTFTPDGKTLVFTRFAFQGSHTKRYKGGTAQNLWRFGDGDAEAVPLTADWAGTSREPMWWNGRIWFASDRDGTINLWSIDAQGGDLKQHTAHRGWDVTSPDSSEGR
ncbi:hypothetical protein EHM82_02805, partial [bacterium]